MVLKETELFRRKQNEMFMNIYESVTITRLIENWIIIQAAAIILKNNALMDFAHDIIYFLHSSFLWRLYLFCYCCFLVIYSCEKLCVVSFAIECDAGQVPIYIKRIYKGNAYEETFQIWEGEAETGTLMYEKNGLDLADTEQNYEVCLNKALHTLVLLDAYVT